MQYIPPINGDTGNANRPYINANPGASIEGSIPPAESWEYPQREILNVITAAGLTPTNSNLGQLKLAIDALILAGSATKPTYQYLKTGTSATYTRPANCKGILVRMVGGGGGGGDTGGTAAGAGGDTSFNGIVAKGGVGGAPAIGGTKPAISGSGSGTASLRIPSSRGASGGYNHAGSGGCSPFGGGGVGIVPTTGSSAQPNSGSGGGGGYVSNGSQLSAGGGDAGEYVEFYILNPAGTYTFTIGAGGTAGALGSSNTAGGAGGSGLIIVEEFY